jgi:hypothetical protein
MKDKVCLISCCTKKLKEKEKPEFLPFVPGFIMVLFNAPLKCFQLFNYLSINIFYWH